jgi:hypothetical protein
MWEHVVLALLYWVDIGGFYTVDIEDRVLWVAMLSSEITNS